ncbi:MAG TPA: sensor domain-containing diguanylate cyclase [Planctomycetota bacterium]|jgi:diguanylate cyclase (GGDEF)-like protein
MDHPGSPRSSSTDLRAVISTQTDIAAAGLDVNRVMQVVVERTLALTGAAGAAVEMVEGDELVSRAVAGGPVATLGVRLGKHNSFSGLCLMRRETLRCDDALTEPHVDRSACQRCGVRSMVATPLVHQDTPVGVLKILSHDPGTFDNHDVQVLKLMAGLIAATLAHAAQYEDQKEAAETAFFRATHDALTGLANRALFFDRLNHALAIAKRENIGLVVLMADIDNMKKINDSFGHKAGDLALKAVAARVQSALRNCDTLARIGGDEFAVLPTGTHNKPAAVQVIHRISEHVRGAFLPRNTRTSLGLSIGAAVFPADGQDAEALMHAADVAMYKSKRARHAAHDSARFTV